MRLLLVEDDVMVASGIKLGLCDAGYAVDWVGSAERAEEALRSETFDAALIDIGLPAIDGLGLLRVIRRSGVAMPVLLLTARDALQDRVQGLDAGADDYITKPFSTQELMARIRAVLRRRAPEQVAGQLLIGALSLDGATHRVAYQGHELRLGPTEFKLLNYLMTYPERVHSRTQLLDKIWGDHVFIEERTVDVHVKRLREALGDAGTMVETVRGAGYRMTSSVAVSP